MKHSSLLQQFTALGDKTRYAIVLSMVQEKGLCVSEIAETLSVTPAAISQHMKILEQAGIIRAVRDGRKVCYALNQTTDTDALVTLIRKEETQ